MNDSIFMVFSSVAPSLLRAGDGRADNEGDMRTIAIINATGANEFAFEPFADGPGSFNRVLELMCSVASPDDVLVLAGPGFRNPDGVVLRNVVESGEWSMRSLLDAAVTFAADRHDADAVVYGHADSPFLDGEMAGRLLALHRRYRAEYTYADGYPPGFSVEILSTRALPNIARLASANDIPADRDGLFAVIQKDINSYDIETELSPVDLRAYRFSPLCDTRRNMVSARRLWEAGVRNAADVVRVLPERLDLLRNLPAFLWVQIAGGCLQSCSYCPYPLMTGDPRKVDGFMPVASFESIMAQAEALCDDLVVDLSLWGEPSLHPEFPELVERVLARPRFTLIVETSGLGWKPGLAERVAASGGSRVQWIVSLDESEETGYHALRGDGYAEAVDFAGRLAAAAPGRVHIQAVRMTSNEERLESFYRGWKKISEKVIIQKFDSFAGLLPDQSVADLTPLVRYPCRHLARDMAVLLDGSVPSCKHCLVRGADGSVNYAKILGNAFDGGLARAWEAGEQWYQAHIDGEYPGPCEACDEYHTFNA